MRLHAVRRNQQSKILETHKSNPWFTPALRAFRTTLRRAEIVWKGTRTAFYFQVVFHISMQPLP